MRGCNTCRSKNGVKEESKGDIMNEKGNNDLYYSVREVFYLGLAFVLMLRPFFPELVMSTDLLSFEHPSVLLFCSLDTVYVMSGLLSRHWNDTLLNLITNDFAILLVSVHKLVLSTNIWSTKNKSDIKEWVPFGRAFHR